MYSQAGALKCQFNYSTHNCISPQKVLIYKSTAHMNYIVTILRYLVILEPDKKYELPGKVS